MRRYPTRRAAIPLTVLASLIVGCGAEPDHDASIPLDVSALDVQELAPDGGRPPDPIAPRDPVALPIGYDRSDVVARLTEDLEGAGFEVDEGVFDLFFVEDCAALPTCYGNNPTSPYGLYFLPPAPGEAPFSIAPIFQRGGLSAGWRLREDEAIVWIGRTPPPSAYFGFRSYVFAREGAELFASLGDTANQFVTGTGSSDGGSGAFDHESVFITTADRAMDTELRTRLGALGIVDGMINTDSIPREPVRMGLGADTDVFTMLFRIALPDDEAAGRAWMDAPPAAVLRIRPTSARAIDPFPMPTLRARGTGFNERHLRGALDRLGASIAAQDPGGTEAPMIALTLDGFACLENTTECQGDNRDTIYVISLPATLGDDDAWWIYGVNHERTGKATYVNLSALDITTRTGVGGIARDALDDTANDLLPASDPDRDLLYAIQVRRHCDGAPACLEIPYDFPGVADGNPLTIAMRPYLEPATATAPLASELLLPRIYRVSR